MKEITQKDVEFLGKLMPGDIFPMRGDRDLISKIKRWLIGEKESHVATYAGNGNVIEAVWHGVREIHWTETDYLANYNVIAMRKTGITQEKADKIIAYQRERIGCNYDFLRVLVMSIIWFLRWFRIDLRRYSAIVGVKSMYTCIELAVQSYSSQDLCLFDYEKTPPSQGVPNDLVESKMLEKVAEYIA